MRALRCFTAGYCIVACAMDQYTVDEALALITGESEYVSNGESDIEEDPEFLPPHSDDEHEAEDKLELTGQLSPSHSFSTTPVLPCSSAENSAGKLCFLHTK